MFILVCCGRIRLAILLLIMLNQKMSILKLSTWSPSLSCLCHPSQLAKSRRLSFVASFSCSTEPPKSPSNPSTSLILFNQPYLQHLPMPFLLHLFCLPQLTSQPNLLLTLDPLLPPILISNILCSYLFFFSYVPIQTKTNSKPHLVYHYCHSKIPPTVPPIALYNLPSHPNPTFRPSSHAIRLSFLTNLTNLLYSLNQFLFLLPIHRLPLQFLLTLTLSTKVAISLSLPLPCLSLLILFHLLFLCLLHYPPLTLPQSTSFFFPIFSTFFIAHSSTLHSPYDDKVQMGFLFSSPFLL